MLRMDVQMLRVKNHLPPAWLDHAAIAHADPFHASHVSLSAQASARLATYGAIKDISA
jgi:hypothetical protein